MFLKNKNIIFKIRRSKVTDYAALSIYTKCYFSSLTGNTIKEPNRATFLEQKNGIKTIRKSK